MTKRESQTVLTLKNDFLFKVVYGSDNEDSKFILMALLNKILRREDDPIVDIEHKNPFQYRQYFDDKEMVLDIKVITSKGELIDVEMQLIWQKDLKERFIAYHGGLIREALSRGQTYDKMKPTITIGIVDAVFLEDEESFINEFYFMNRNSHAVLSENSYICCIELPKVNRERRPVEELTPLELCLEYLKHADENGSEYVDALIERGGKELQMAQFILQKATEDEILREQAIAREKFEHDMLSMKCYTEELERKREAAERGWEEAERGREAAEKGREVAEKGREEAEKGREEAEKGREAAEREKDEALSRLGNTVAGLKARGMRDDEISGITGLPMEEIAKL